MKVKDAMHKNAEWVAPDTPVAAVAKKMKDLDVGSLPVGENDRLIGMVTDRDIACRGVGNGKDCSKLTARDVMTKGIVYCRDTEDLDDAMRIMENKKIRRLPVINEKEAFGRDVECRRCFPSGVARVVWRIDHSSLWTPQVDWLRRLVLCAHFRE